MTSIGRECTLSRIEGDLTWLGDRKIEISNDIGEAGTGFVFLLKESEFYAECNEAVKQQSGLMRCSVKEEHSGCRRRGMGDMSRLRLRGTISSSSHTD